MKKGALGAFAASEPCRFSRSLVLSPLMILFCTTSFQMTQSHSIFCLMSGSAEGWPPQQIVQLIHHVFGGWR